MTETILFKDWVFEVDVVRTKKIYEERNFAATCHCNDCENFRAQNLTDYFPDEVKDLFGQLGIDPCKETEVSCVNDGGNHYYDMNFYFKGKIVKGKDCKKNFPGGGHTYELIALSDNLWISFSKDSTLSPFEKSEAQDVIMVGIAVNMKWVINEPFF